MNRQIGTLRAATSSASVASIQSTDRPSSAENRNAKVTKKRAPPAADGRTHGHAGTDGRTALVLTTDRPTAPDRPSLPLSPRMHGAVVKRGAGAAADQSRRARSRELNPCKWDIHSSILILDLSSYVLFSKRSSCS